VIKDFGNDAKIRLTFFCFFGTVNLINGYCLFWE
jgi:hypothetical protein